MARYRRKYGRRRFKMRRMRRRPRFIKRRRYRRGWLSKVHTFKRTNVDTQTFNLTSAQPAYVFQLNEIPNYTEWTALYDQYKISKVVVKLVPRNSQVVSPTANQGNLFSVIDYTDSNSLLSADEANEYASVKRTRGFKSHVRVLRPRLQVPLYKSGSLSWGYGSRSGWVNTTNPEVPHFGLKFFWECIGGVESVEFDQYVTYYVKFKNVK